MKYIQIANFKTNGIKEKFNYTVTLDGKKIGMLKFWETITIPVEELGNHKIGILKSVGDPIRFFKDQIFEIVSKENDPDVRKLKVVVAKNDEYFGKVLVMFFTLFLIISKTKECILRFT